MIAPRFGALLGLTVLFLPAQELKDYERKVTEFTLNNGLHFIVLERHQLPIVSFHTYVNVGSAEDPTGQTGLSHLFEHLAFKGTESIGTHNWSAEKKALDDLETAYNKLQAEKVRGPKADSFRMTSLEVAFHNAVEAAQAQESTGDFSRVIQENGGVGVSCKAGPDAIQTSYSLPSNRAELWFLMESDRIAHPVFRDFYRERDQMQVENRNTIESRSLPILERALLSTAFEASPYHNPNLGWPSDVENLRLSDAREFFEKYFMPANIAIGIVGDVDPGDARRLAEKYFGAIPAKPAPLPIHTAEPKQFGPKTVSLIGNLSPLLLVGFKRPGDTEPGDPVFDVIRSILGQGRTSWLYKSLIEEKGIAQSVDAVATYPAGRHINLFVVSVVPARNHTLQENQQAVDALLARLQNQPVDIETLNRVKNEVRTRIARILGNNQDLAALLPTYFANFGDWRRLFTEADEIAKVTSDDVQRVAIEFFIPANRTVAYLTNEEQASAVTARTGGAQ